MPARPDSPDRIEKLTEVRAGLRRACHPCGCLLALPIVLALVLIAAAGSTPTHGQRAVIIVDGEQIEIEFDEVDLLREQIEQQFRNQRGNVRNIRPLPAQEIDVSLPDDEELSRVQIDPELLAVVAELDSDSYSVREEAMQRLLESFHDYMQYYAVLATEELTTEQRSRLLMVVRQQLIHGPRGAVGISMIPHHGPDGTVQIEVDRLIEGLPAERVLRPGDRITHLDGEALRSPDQLTVRVQARRPGEQVTLTVLRPHRDEHGRLVRDPANRTYDELSIDLTLGSAELLDNAGGPRIRNIGVEQRRRLQVQAIMERFGPRHAAIELDRDEFSP